ncbi:hypothetical protein [Streptomyces sp. NBC_00273]|uniref:hypothetical protein n=1 Tax=Streptomyces sp. NBC_00273 TaxID=2903644 RepID=UPI003FA6FF0D
MADDRPVPGEGGRCLRRRQIEHTVPERKDRQADGRRRGRAGGRPTGFDERAYPFHDAVTVAAVRLWLRS